ncbi:TrkH family potassium uptake protein [Pseudogemmobacter faecipullorum]|uniref:Trk system potassium uptake protein n=1 Tax=Pseudogemmobacter faecipullorum TaxID=2755041 RepID=A0ABS8CMH3_9RHOB|nr:TrkH family potassium uptake protein [Pseudogemmobacter faecipullorum]MCB5410574.1 TrkH family potassium uptake protein [Pseudogemmobacter faecipullorum]
MIDLRPVAYVLGRILIVLALLMLAPAVLDWRAGDPNGFDIFRAALITFFTGMAVALATSNTGARSLDVRQAYLLTASIWIIAPLFAALPLMLGAPGLPLAYAWFEAVSGLTTTGATVIVGLDNLPAGMNLWRVMCNWLGGLGIAFIAMIFLPLMRIGGMQFFRTEAFDTLGKALPRAADIARQLLYIYVVLTFICIITFLIIGMPPFIAVSHGLSAVSTGGFSPYDSSFSGYRGAGEYFGALFMFLGSLPFVRYVQMVNGQPMQFWRDQQIRSYLIWLLTAVLMVTLWRVLDKGTSFEPTFREALFNMTSIMSSTGTFSGDFSGWGGFALVMALLIGIIGGCSGSTAAGLSVFRVQIAMAALRRQIGQIFHPSQVSPIRYQARPVDEDVIRAVTMYIATYILLLGLVSVTLTLIGLDLQSALFAAWTCLGNIGYGFGPMVARTGTFIDFPPAAIFVLSLTMIIGRLGILTMLILLLPVFWRR